MSSSSENMLNLLWCDVRRLLCCDMCVMCVGFAGFGLGSRSHARAVKVNLRENKIWNEGKVNEKVEVEEEVMWNEQKYEQKYKILLTKSFRFSFIFIFFIFPKLRHFPASLDKTYHIHLFLIVFIIYHTRIRRYGISTNLNFLGAFFHFGYKKINF